MMNRFAASIAAATLLLLPAACSKRAPQAAYDQGPDTNGVVKPHVHKAPHDGTPVVLGNEAYHLELVHDAAAGKLSVYVLDAHMENFIRIGAPALEIIATVDGTPRPLRLAAIADSATGEKVGETSLFETEADWLKTATTFDGVLTQIEIRGTVFPNVAFNFPRGNEAP